MVKTYQPLQQFVAPPPLSHEELVENEKTGLVEKVKIEDSGFVCDPDDFDLDVLQRSGEKIKEVSTTIFRSRPLAGIREDDEIKKPADEAETHDEVNNEN